MADDPELDALLDGECGPEERAALEARLAADPDLRERYEALRATDGALREAYAFAPEMAEAAAARFRLPGPAPAPALPRRLLPWLLLPAAAAAGILLGLSLRPPPPLLGPGPAPPPPTEPPLAGFLSLATGEVSVEGRGPLSTGKPLREGDRLLVPEGVRAALVLSDGTEVRLDRGARVRIPGGRCLEVEMGRVWSRVARGEPFRLEAGATRVTVLGTELSVRRGAEGTGVQLFSGSARVEAGGAVRDLRPGQEAEFSDGILSEARRIDSEAIATGWMLELWARSGARDRDLAEHLDRMLAEMGHRKLAVYEALTIVRELAPVCRVPIAKFLASESARTEPEQRRKAARVLREIADATVAPELAAALRDPDPEVRVEAARTLRRLSEGRVCAEPERFAGGIDEGAAAAAADWAREAALNAASAAPPPGSGGTPPGR